MRSTIWRWCAGVGRRTLAAQMRRMQPGPSSRASVTGVSGGRAWYVVTRAGVKCSGNASQ